MTAELQYPLSRIFIGPKKTLAICGSQLFTLNSQSGAVETSTTVDSAEKNVSSVVRIAAVDATYQHLVTSGDDKRLRVWSIHDLKELSCREIPKRANVLRLTQDGQSIIVADKFGDIFSYPLVPPELTPQPQPTENAASKSIAVAMHDNPHGTLILGHASIVTAFVLTHGEKQVVSADRDEHVRVSWYPEGWDVDRYCMGHKKFVSALEIPSCAPSILISGGGDPELYVWEYKTGKDIARIPVWDHIRPFLKIKGGRRESEKPQGKKKKKKTAVESQDVEMTTESKSGEEFWVVSKINQVRLGEEDVVVFSAVGCSALFYFRWSSSLDFGGVEVRSLDLTNPVVDFTVTQDGTVWVSVDPTWSTVLGAISTTESTDSRRVRRLVWKDAQIVEDNSESQLAQGLNQGCDVKGPANETHKLGIYDPLFSLPKTAEFETPDGAEGTPVPSDITSGPGLRASARQKNKEELEKRKALTQEATRATKQPRVEET
ncbi:WD40-repeat-containing domain protein [Rhizoctonia solani]|nr:WD40-repeat-containing domain protein [Rhizoctonia solani]